MIDDPTMGPCVACGRPGEAFSVPHTGCECDLESCHKAICDDCRFAGGNWVWMGEEDKENMREVHIDCFNRMTAG